MNGVFLFNITGGKDGASSSWTVDAKSAGGKVSVGEGAKPDCTITISDAGHCRHRSLPTPVTADTAPR